MKKRSRFSVLFLCLLLLLSARPLQGKAAFSEPLKVKSAIVIDAATGEVFFDQEAQAKRYPASTTKMMTALIVAEEGNLSQRVTVSESSGEGLGDDSSSVEPALKTGEVLSLEDLLKCILITSDNRACNVVAEALCGSVEVFVGKMNNRARALGCTGTNFANPHGLHDENHYTTAADLAKIAQAVLGNDTLMTVCETTEAAVSATNLNEKRTLRSTNFLIRPDSSQYYYSRARGIKTGFTTPAGYCLVSSARKDDLEVIAVVMGGERDEETSVISSFTDCKKLLKWALDSFQQTELVKKGEILAELPVALSSERDYVMVCTGASFKKRVPSDFDAGKLERDIVLDSPDGIDAPVEAGQVLGHMALRYEGKDYGQVDLVAATAVSFDGKLLVARKVGEFFSSPVFWIVFILVALALSLYAVHVAKVNRERRRSRW